MIEAQESNQRLAWLIKPTFERDQIYPKLSKSSPRYEYALLQKQY